VVLLERGGDRQRHRLCCRPRLAREVARARRPDTYRFVLFGEEEAGLRGSRCYVAGLSDEEAARIRFVVNLDSVGLADLPNGVLTERCPWLEAQALAVASARGFALEPWSFPSSLAAGDNEPFEGTSFGDDVVRGLLFNSLSFFLPARSWFTKERHFPTVAFVAHGIFAIPGDSGDMLTYATLALVPVCSQLHGPRDNATRVDAWRLYEQYEIVRELTATACCPSVSVPNDPTRSR
jgi:hypothetical protein